MKENWLESPNAVFHHLVFNTPIEYPLCADREQALRYLKIINSPNFYYNSFSNYNIIDFEKIIYLDEVFKNDEEIQKLLLEVKGQIARSYNYKNQYLKRITDFIPKERFDLIYDNYMVKAFDFPNPMKESEEEINDRN